MTAAYDLAKMLDDARAAADEEARTLTALRARGEALLYTTDGAAWGWEIVPCPEPGGELTTYPEEAP